MSKKEQTKENCIVFIDVVLASDLQQVFITKDNFEGNLFSKKCYEANKQ